MLTLGEMYPGEWKSLYSQQILENNQYKSSTKASDEQSLKIEGQLLQHKCIFESIKCKWGN